MTFVSYAQNFEDVLLWRALRGVERGFYIDAGAAHPDIDSVTRAFYDRGWHGMNIEPTEEYSLRLSAARPRDINLKIVLGERRGEVELLEVDGTGLSTLDTGALSTFAQAGMAVKHRVCAMETLADLCRRHAPQDIHFLKIDVEGAEDRVLAGADFIRYRPWIVVVEATAPMSTIETHEGWEPALLRQGYKFAWFDGLNRFYIAEEQHEMLAPHFRTPPNVFDDFVRAADGELARRIGDAERRADGLLHRAGAAEAQVVAEKAAATRVAAAAAEARERSQQVMASLQEDLTSEQQRIEEMVAAAEAAAAATAGWMRTSEAQARLIGEQRVAAIGWLNAVLGSTSWRITRPLRRLRSRRDTVPPQFPDPPALPPPPVSIGVLDKAAPLAPLPVRPRVGGVPIRTVHQFHSGSAVGDAITNAMRLMRDLLRGLGYRSDIFVEHRDPALADELRLYDELPHHDRYVLIVHHSMGFDAFAAVASLPAPKVLIYHNITPPELLAESPVLQRYARLGRTQLAKWRHRVSASLADSEYNAIELRALGFNAVQVCMLLFDVDRLLKRAEPRAERPQDRTFTVLFVGRICASKCQHELVDAYAAFQRQFKKPSRLVLVGRHGGDTDPYVGDIRARAVEHGIENSVILTGLVSDDALHAHYAAADMFVCLSEHEGFCVPLIEAVAYSLPVLARPAAAIPYTLADTDGLLMQGDTDAVAARMLQVAMDEPCRERLCRQQRGALEYWRVANQLPALLQALAISGAAPPVSTASEQALSVNVHFAIAGHVNGNYSLAAVNRMLALQLEASHPGRVRLLPVEGQARAGLTSIPTTHRDRIRRLVDRKQPATKPEVFISQHYPIHVPQPGGDLNVSLFFWEESGIPADTVALLNRSFDAVFAPSSFVAKVLIDSGVSLPIRIIGISPPLDAYRELAAKRRERVGAPFTFLHVSSCFPRKGIDVLLRAYARAFRRGDNVRLVIKGFPNPHNDAAEQLAQLRSADGNLPAIEMIDRDIDETEMLSLYRDADAMVLPTRGEGFNLPAAEALAAGLKLIVTGYGGHVDFCNAGRTRLIDYTFATSRSHLASPGSVWVEPDEADLVDALRVAATSCSRTLTAVDDPLPAMPCLSDVAARLLTAPPSAPVDIAWISSWNVRCGIAEYSHYLIEAMPLSPAVGSITVLCDSRTVPAGEHENHITVLPCWNLGLNDGASDLARIISVRDPHIVVIQHQPGLIEWGALAALLAAPALRERLVVITLHSTERIFDSAKAERSAVVGHLAGVARVVVHTVADLNRLKTLGLIANVVLIPQGVPAAMPNILPPGPAIRNSAPLIGCYGFFLPEKGIARLIEAVGRLRGSHPGIRLRLVNADYGSADSRDEIGRCRTLAEALDLGDAIEWHTTFLPNEESRKLLEGCDVIALPYQASKEASSAALRFAIGVGPPLLVTPLPLFDEATDAVWRASGLDAPALVDGLTRLLADPDERGRIRQAAGLWIRQHAWPMIARRMQGMLLGLAAADEHAS